MKKSIIFIFINYLFSINYIVEPNYGAVIINQELYNNPFLGGFNKPKIQWIDWTGNGIDELFLLDEDGSIRYFKSSSSDSDYVLIETDFLNISNISWFYIYDFDLDNEFEIITQDPSNINQMLYYEIDNNNVIQIGTIYENNFTPVYSDAVMTPTFCDIDNDQDLDFFTGNMIGTITFYENIGIIDNTPTFEMITDFWQEIYIVGPSQNRHGASAISFVDIDGDSDYDLSWGDYYQQSLYIIINNGTIDIPNMDNDNIIFEFPSNNPIISAGLNMPTFTDIDNDGDQDLFVTVLSGAYGFQLKNNFYFFENEFYNNSSNYIIQTSEFIKTMDLLSDVAPSFVDINNDNKLDMFIGTDFNPEAFPWTGTINYFENSSNIDLNEKLWTLVNDDFIEGDLGNNIVVELADIDNDNDYDIFIGNFNGTVQFFENIGDIENPNFLYVENIANIDISGYSVPRLNDIDSDGDYDLFLGQLNGKISYYENVGNPSYYEFNLVDDYFESINVSSRSTPDFIDIDLDGDLDMILGSQSGQIYYYKNIGDGYNFDFVYDETIYFPYLGRNTVPQFINDKELFVGVSTGGLYYLSTCNHPDINNDYQINISDIILVVDLIINQSINDIQCQYDLNNDNIINVIDIIYLINIILF